MFATCRLVLRELPRTMHGLSSWRLLRSRNDRTMSHSNRRPWHFASFVVALGLASLGCEDDSPKVSGEGSGGAGGADPASLDGNNSTGGTAGNGGSGGSANTGGGGSGTGGGVSDATSTSDGPAAGGSGGTATGPGGTGGSAGVNLLDGCDDDPRCDPLPDDCVGNNATACEDTDEDGCLEFVQENCAPGSCQAGECVGEADGEACDAALDVVSSGFLLAGADFGIDFADDLELSGNSCALPQQGAPDVAFQVTLKAGQTLSVLERGDMYSVAHVQAACGAAEACLASSDNVDFDPLLYPAAADETVTVVVEAADEVPNPAWYRIHVDIDPACGNGVLEGFEDCDTGDPPVSAGCSGECTVEFGYECEATSPSLCTPLVSLGEFGVGDSVEPIVERDKFEVWDEDRWSISISETVLFAFDATSRVSGFGDVQIEILNEAGRVAAYRVTGDEVDQPPLGLQAGTYVIRVYAETPLPEGYRIDFALSDPGECGDGVVEPALEECDTDGEPGCSEECKVEFDHLCAGTEPTVCDPIDSLGEFAADDTLEPQTVEDVLEAGASSYWLFTLSEEVLLTGTVAAIGAGDPNVFIYSAADAYGYPTPLENIGPEFLELLLPAGEYKIEVRAQDTLDQGYTFTFETEAP